MALKTALLQILEEHRDAPVSGQALADRLHVSRAAVWKAMKALQAEGHRITAVTNRGYQLERDSDVLTPQGIRCRLRPAYRDCAIRVDARVPSTNTQAKKLAADGEAAPSLLLADGQTAGRGRMGRAFFSPPGTGLYMSVLLRPAVQAEELPLVTLAAAAAVCEAVEEAAGVSTRVKWVNNCERGGWELGCRIDGCQAEYVRVPFADSGLTHIPDGVSDEKALLLGDILASGYFGAELCAIRPGDTVAVIGAGPVGLCAMLCARLFGAAEVIALDTDETRLRVALERGLCRLALNPRHLGETEAHGAPRS